MGASAYRSSPGYTIGLLGHLFVAVLWHLTFVDAGVSYLNKRLCYCRETARRSTSVEILWPFLTELLTRSSATAEEPCEHTVS